MTETAVPAQRFGRCLNLGRCELADTDAHIPITAGMDMTCPQCQSDIVERPPAGKPLVNLDQGPKPVPRRLLILGGVLVAAITAGIAFDLFSIPEDPAEEQAEEIAQPLGTALPPNSVLLFTMGATAETRGRLAPALGAAFMTAKGCTGVAEQHLSGDKLRLGCDKKGFHFVIDIDPVEAATAFAPRPGRPIDLLLTTRNGPGNTVRDKTTIGFGAAAIIVNPANPLRSLSLGQLADIFAGKTESFSVVGGPAATIRRVAGDAGTPELRAFEALVPGGGALAGSTRRLADSRAVATAVAGDPDAIGLVNPAHTDDTRVLAIRGDGVAALPSPAAIAAGRYPLAHRLEIEVPPASKVRFARPFAAFAAGADGQKVVLRSGYLPLPQPAAPPGP
jgi:phosphate transport system substrate-binding protein